LIAAILIVNYTFEIYGATMPRNMLAGSGKRIWTNVSHS